jgi:DNA polymerase-1
MAALSGDAGLKAAFVRGADIHTETATRVYGVLPGLVTPEMRSRCKMVNFGIIYGISAFGLAQRLGVPRKQAADLIETYFAQYPGVKAYMDRTIAFAREHGYVRTELGRRRVTSRQAAERNAVNTPVQGTAADLIKLAMVRIHRELAAAGLKARMVLQVHDELLFDVPRTEEPAVRELVTRAMCGALDLGVPLAVEIGSGENWLEAH